MQWERERGWCSMDEGRHRPVRCISLSLIRLNCQGVPISHLPLASSYNLLGSHLEMPTPLVLIFDPTTTSPVVVTRSPPILRVRRQAQSFEGQDHSLATH